MDSAIELEFIKVVGELAVAYYDKHVKRKTSFNGFCASIKTSLTTGVTYANTERYDHLLLFLMTGLEKQYGLTSDIASAIILDFFQYGYWNGIYDIQKKYNELSGDR